MPEEPAGGGPNRIQAVERAAAILGAFTSERPELGVTEIARAAGLHKSTAYRFLANLEAGGLVERAGGRSYRLGLRLFELGGLPVRWMPLWEEAGPALRALAEATGETAQLGVPGPAGTLRVERAAAPLSMRPPAAPATEVLARALGGEMAADADGDPVCVAAPVRDRTGRVAAAIAVAGPPERISPARAAALGDAVAAAAADLSDRLAAQPPPALRSARIRVRRDAPGRAA